MTSMIVTVACTNLLRVACHTGYQPSSWGLIAAFIYSWGLSVIVLGTRAMAAGYHFDLLELIFDQIRIRTPERTASCFCQQHPTLSTHIRKTCLTDHIYNCAIIDVSHFAHLSAG